MVRVGVSRTVEDLLRLIEALVGVEEVGVVAEGGCSRGLSLERAAVQLLSLRIVPPPHVQHVRVVAEGAGVPRVHGEGLAEAALGPLVVPRLLVLVSLRTQRVHLGVRRRIGADRRLLARRLRSPPAPWRLPAPRRLAVVVVAVAAAPPSSLVLVVVPPCSRLGGLLAGLCLGAGERQRLHGGGRGCRLVVLPPAPPEHRGVKHVLHRGTVRGLGCQHLFC
mmetsp:Transcript_46092/g.109904  ORF Transcript_46092/g.109904 Transcript_46092/m.109904 type:complete len:221 (-) Transcript_46092:978-1640(-)